MPLRSITASQLTGLLGDGPLASPAYASLADRIRMLAIDGRLVPDQRLPAERDLALRLAVSRTTVTAAYDRLKDSGYLRSTRGAGHFVVLPHRRQAHGFLPGSFRTGEDQIVWNCASGAGTPGLAAAFGRAAERLPELLTGSGYLPDGLDELRERIAARYGERGLDTDPDQIVVTAGALSALGLVVSTVCTGHDRVLLESPTYSNAIEAVRRAGARPIGYPMVDGLSGADDGWHAADFGRTLDQTGSRLAYLIPEHQNPTGFTMREPTRVAIARELQRRRLTAVVDETLVELDLDTRPGAPLGTPLGTPLAALLPDAISIGSASKAFWGGLRVGWIRAPRSLVPRLVETRASLDLGTAAYEQLVVAELLRDPAGVLDAQRERLRGQRDRLIELVRGALPEWEFRVPGGGLSLWVRLPTPSSSRLAEAAEARGLVITPGYRFFVDGGGERYVRLPFAHSGEVLDEAVGRLEEAWRSVGTGGSMAGRMRSAIDLSA